VIFLLLFFLACPPSAAQNPGAPQEAAAQAGRLEEVRRLYAEKQWDQVVRVSSGVTDAPAELDYLRGMALARLGRWQEAREALESAQRKAPREARYLEELAGTCYRLNDSGAAKKHLRAALQLEPRDAYALEFLGTIYFLEGNLEAALKYWNRIEKPRLASVAYDPQPLLKPKILGRVADFSAPGVLRREALLTTRARLDAPGIFPRHRVELDPAANDSYEAKIRVLERNGWGPSALEGTLSLFRGVPYSTVFPEWFNLGHAAVNVTSLVRWDSEKRRAGAELSAPVASRPDLRVRLYFDGRNENWNLAETLFTSGPLLGNLNVRRWAVGAEFRSVVNGRWSWSSGVEASHRAFRNIEPVPAAALVFFRNATLVQGKAGVEHAVARIAERRLTLDATAEARFGHTFADGLGNFGAVTGGLLLNWLPQNRGNDYAMQAQLRSGGIIGRVPFDELFQLGLERDNDLLLRGQASTTGGRKGRAPLGRHYALFNWEMDKNLYDGALFSVKAGPLLDAGIITDPTPFFNQPKWLWDPGAQVKIRILGVTLILMYGHDVRKDRNVYYIDATREL
jgi:hypothetical protein